MNCETLLWGIRKGNTERWQEELLLTQANPARIAKCKEIAMRDGWHSFRVATIRLDVMPDFTKAVNV